MKKELILKILDQLDKNNKILSQEEVEIDADQYGQIFDIMFESHLISGGYINRIGTEGKYTVSDTKPSITLAGIEYLEKSKDNYNRLIGAMNNFPSEMGTGKYKLNINQTY